MAIWMIQKTSDFCCFCFTQNRGARAWRMLVGRRRDMMVVASDKGKLPGEYLLRASSRVKAVNVRGSRQTSELGPAKGNWLKLIGARWSCGEEMLGCGWGILLSIGTETKKGPQTGPSMKVASIRSALRKERTVIYRCQKWPVEKETN